MARGDEKPGPGGYIPDYTDKQLIEQTVKSSTRRGQEAVGEQLARSLGKRAVDERTKRS